MLTKLRILILAFISRLIHDKARNFYQNYLDGTYYSNLKTKIKYFLNYFDASGKKNVTIYIGDTFGETGFKAPGVKEGELKNYIDINSKSHAEKVNLAVIKSKIEDDFISYKLGKLVKTLYDLELISENILNIFLFNTDNINIINLKKAGLSNQFISFISDNNLINDIKVKEYGIKITEKFKSILVQQDDFIKFEISKYL